MSLIGLQTATEKQLHLGSHHLRLIQWHLENDCRATETPEKIIPIPRSLYSHLKWWFHEKQSSAKPAITSPKSRFAILCRCIKIRLGHSLQGTHYKGYLVPCIEQIAHKLSETNGCLSGPKTVRRPLLEQNSPHSYKQHHSRGLKLGSLCVLL